MIAPSDAELTSFAYFAKTPLFSLGSGIFQLLLLMVNFVDQGEDLMLQLLNLFKQLDLFFIFLEDFEIHIVHFILLKLKRRPCLIQFTFFGPQ